MVWALYEQDTKIKKSKKVSSVQQYYAVKMIRNRENISEGLSTGLYLVIRAQNQDREENATGDQKGAPRASVMVACLFSSGQVTFEQVWLAQQNNFEKVEGTMSCNFILLWPF